MDLYSELITTPYAFHGLVVGAVVLLALSVFVFGFKSAEEPPFDKLTDDRRGAAGKKKKVKDKKAQSNGHATAVSDSGSGKRSEVKTPKKEEKKEAEKSPSKEKQKQEKKSPAKTTLKENKTNKENSKADVNKQKAKGKGKENVEVAAKNKKNKQVEEKPKDYDDGEWEQALSRKDKKNRKTTLEEILPQKNEKKKDKKKSKDEEEERVKVATPEPPKGATTLLTEIIETIPYEAIPITEIITDKTNDAIETSNAAPSSEKIETLIVETVEASTEGKPKKQKAKKKQAPPPPVDQGVPTTPPKVTASPKAAPEKTAKVDKPVKGMAPQPPAAQVAVDLPEPVADPAPPKVQRQEKKKPKESQPASEKQVAPAEVIEAPSVEPSNVVFDELGDTWKEAKAPKKSNKKKTRKD